MKFKVISCEVFRHEIEHALRSVPHVCDVEFLELGEHARPQRLRMLLQQKIDAAVADDAVLLGYGLCGRATDGLTARRIPLILPRSHDCGGILLGSRKRFEEIFAAMPSAPFSSIGYMECGNYYFTNGDMFGGDSYAALVEKYGEDDASYIRNAMQVRLDGRLQDISFIVMPEIPCAAAIDRCRRMAAAEGRGFQLVPGSLRLIAGLLRGDWNSEEFLVVQPGETVRQTGDLDEIIRASK